IHSDQYKDDAREKCEVVCTARHADNCPACGRAANASEAEHDACHQVARRQVRFRRDIGHVADAERIHGADEDAGQYEGEEAHDEWPAGYLHHEKCGHAEGEQYVDELSPSDPVTETADRHLEQYGSEAEGRQYPCDLRQLEIMPDGKHREVAVEGGLEHPVEHGE